MQVGSQHTPYRSIDGGFTVVEVIVSLVLLAVIITPFVSLMNVQANQNSKNAWRTKMSAASQTMFSKIRSDTSWVSTVDSAGSVCSNSFRYSTTNALGWCNISNQFAASDEIFWNKTGETADHEQVFDNLNIIRARGIDSPDDGLRFDDKDQLMPDYYIVEITVRVKPDSSLYQQLGNLAPVTLTSNVKPVRAGMGSVSVQSCLVTNQADARRPISHCYPGTSEVMKEPLRFSHTYYSEEQEGQAYGCAHPTFNSIYSGWTMWASGNPITAGYWDYSGYWYLCHSASPPYADSTVGPGVYPPWFDTATNKWQHPVIPRYKPDWTKVQPLPGLPTDQGQLKYVTTTVARIGGATVRIKGIEPASITSISIDKISDDEGLAVFSNLPPGRYQISIVANGPNANMYELWEAKSVPGKYVTVSQGVVKKATQVFRPNPNAKTILNTPLHRFNVSIREIDTHWPWDCNTDSGTLDLRRPINGMWSNVPLNTADAEARNGGFRVRALQRVISPQSPTCSRTPPPPGAANVIYHNLKWGGICATLDAVPNGRVENASYTKCYAPLPIPAVCGTGCQNVTYYDPATPPTKFTWNDLHPGLYSLTIPGWRLDQYPGFVWIDEDGTTFPEGRPNDATYYLKRVIATRENPCADNSIARANYPFAFLINTSTYPDCQFDPTAPIVESNKSYGSLGVS